MVEPETAELKTPIFDFHLELGGKMVLFAGYTMPVHYPAGIMAEHTHTRRSAGLFDVSHMGQARIAGNTPGRAMESMAPGDIQGLKAGEMRYTLLTNENGGIRDDLMVTRLESGDDSPLFIVVNAACKETDFAYIEANLPTGTRLEKLEDRALLALQGPEAAAVLSALAPAAAQLTFMTGNAMDVAGLPCFVTRSGYTGEDGYEISVQTDQALELARKLLSDERVKPIGLGARDSLRLEAGLCLYGHDIDTTTTLIEASLMWAVAKHRRTADAGYPGASVIAEQIEQKNIQRKRVGIVLDGRAPAREGAKIADTDGNVIGSVTSGGFAPTVGGPVVMGYVDPVFAKIGTLVTVLVRGRALSGAISRMPFSPHRYYRGA